MAAEHGDETRARTQCARLLEDAELGAGAPRRRGARRRQARGHGPRPRGPPPARRDDARRAGAGRVARQAGRAGRQSPRRTGAAAVSWKRAAALAESSGDEESARRLYARARKAAPEDREVTERLIALTERAEIWADLPKLYATLAALVDTDPERVEIWSRRRRCCRIGSATWRRQRGGRRSRSRRPPRARTCWRRSSG